MQVRGVLVIKIIAADQFRKNIFCGYITYKHTDINNVGSRFLAQGERSLHFFAGFSANVT